MVLSLFLFITNCQKDDQTILDESQLEKTKPLIINQIIKFEQSLHLKKTEKKVSNLQTKIFKLQSQNRTGEEDITIITDEVLYISYASTHTYTFKIIRETPLAYIENIVLHYDIETADYNEYLVQYHLPVGQYQALYDGAMLQSSENITITQLDSGFFNNQEHERGCNRVCNTIYVSCSGSGGHNFGDLSCPLITTSSRAYSYQSCSSNCELDNEITPPSGESGGGGNGGGNETVVSNPLPNEPCRINGESIGAINTNGECVELDVDCSILSASNLPSLVTALSLTQEQEDCLTNSSEVNCSEVNNLAAFNTENPDNIAFGQLAAQAICDGGEVDYINEVMYYINKPCQKQIVKDVISVSSNLTNLIKNTFNVTDNVNLKFWNGTTSNPNANAVTNLIYEGNSSNYTIKIGYNDTFLDVATNLAIAAATLHEVTHAYFISLYIEGNLVSDDNNYDDLLEAFVAFYANPNNPTFEIADEEIHNAMNTFMDQIAASLLSYAQSKNINGVDLAYCKKLAWGTMLGTDLINEMKTQDEKNEAENIMITEQNNNEYDESVPIKGSACE